MPRSPALVAADPRFGAGARAQAGRPPLRRRADGFAGLCASIVVSQQVSTASARAIWGRLAAAFDPLDHAAVLRARAGEAGARRTVRAKIRTLKAIAKAIDRGTSISPRSPTYRPTRRTPRSPRCTASARGPPTFICSFCLGHADAWPAGDLALQEATRSLLRS